MMVVCYYRMMTSVQYIFRLYKVINRMTYLPSECEWIVPGTITE